jgi:hypothetical protein
VQKLDGNPHLPSDVPLVTRELIAQLAAPLAKGIHDRRPARQS